MDRGSDVDRRRPPVSVLPDIGGRPRGSGVIYGTDTSPRSASFQPRLFWASSSSPSASLLLFSASTFFLSIVLLLLLSPLPSSHLLTSLISPNPSLLTLSIHQEACSQPLLEAGSPPLSRGPVSLPPTPSWPDLLPYALFLYLLSTLLSLHES